MFKAPVAWTLLALVLSVYAQNAPVDNSTANGWTVVYYPGYTVINNLLAQQSYALVPQGQVFTNITGNLPQVQVPITSAAADTLDVLGFAELLSTQNVTSRFVTASSNVLTAHTSPCFSSMTSNATAVYTFTNTTTNANNTIIFSAGNPALSPIQKLSWLQYLGFFFNEERQATSVILNIVNQYNCIKYRLSDGVKEKYSIAWVQADMTNPPQYQIKVDNYARTLIQDASANIIAPNAAQDTNFSNTGNFQLALRGADMLIDTTPLTEGQLYPQWLSIMGMVANLSILYQNEAYYSNKMVFRTDGLVSATGYSDFPERYAARPDLALMDVIAMQYPTFQPSYAPLTWLYNFAQTASPRTMSTNYTCGNAAAQITGQIVCVYNSPFTPPSTQLAPSNETNSGSSNPSSSSDGGLSGGAKAGIAIGVIAGVAAIGGAGFLFWRRRRGGSEPTHNFYKMDDI